MSTPKRKFEAKWPPKGISKPKRSKAPFKYGDSLLSPLRSCLLSPLRQNVSLQKKKQVTFLSDPVKKDNHIPLLETPGKRLPQKINLVKPSVIIVDSDEGEEDLNLDYLALNNSTPFTTPKRKLFKINERKNALQRLVVVEAKVDELLIAAGEVSKKLDILLKQG